MGEENVAGVNNLQRFPRPIKALIPAHQGGFRDMVATTDKLDAKAREVKLDGMESGRNFMWQITIGMWYTVQNG